VGGARFLSGLVEAAPTAEITVIGNTGDDFEVHGLHVSPDLDTVAYTLSGHADARRGWGLAGESWTTLGQLRRLGGETWFQLGDLDLATHLRRTELLRAGLSLSAATKQLCERLGVPVRLLPMTDDRVESRVQTEDGRDLHLQEYLVREAARPAIREVVLRGASQARAPRAVLDALASADAIIFAPSNPVISIGPILAVPGVAEAVRAHPLVAAVSPIVAGRAIKGPAVEMLRSRGLDPSALGVAQAYRGLVHLLVVDEVDHDLSRPISDLGVQVHTCPTLMADGAARRRLAEEVLNALAPLAGAGTPR
jgi:LPPG:FO 2-phospho-L-lactate transferase